MTNELKITESPRDAQQGLPYIIPPEKRAGYINQLLLAGFDVIDFGSFVSPKAIPQMSETDKVLDLIDKANSPTKLLCIVGNVRGGQEAIAQEKVDMLGFPYSISNTFLEKNIHSNLTKVFHTAKELEKICSNSGKTFRVFISMAFGNPYGDPWSEAILINAVRTLTDIGVDMITLSDTTGLATPDSINSVFTKLLSSFALPNLGLHLHTSSHDWRSKIDAAWKGGCRSFDGVINGFGGCPLTGYEMLGNINTLDLLKYFNSENIPHPLNESLIRDIALEYPDFSYL